MMGSLCIDAYDYYIASIDWETHRYRAIPYSSIVIGWYRFLCLIRSNEKPFESPSTIYIFQLMKSALHQSRGPRPGWRLFLLFPSYPTPTASVCPLLPPFSHTGSPWMALQAPFWTGNFSSVWKEKVVSEVEQYRHKGSSNQEGVKPSTPLPVRGGGGYSHLNPLLTVYPTLPSMLQILLRSLRASHNKP
jgi:hypothetical protein